uniref:Apple domain-containing protein n=1 Tax=Eutreptiella gymnastica TaxID=73025 RepID=A0A7S1JHS4_9EUGL|mmetsp:Transcript_9907/g.17517  ORF Transcript_9907/g.17517 Transcript_9907/m.17517 type:complete len:1710 (+) Transcript_9907:121-5250(+)
MHGYTPFIWGVLTLLLLRQTEAESIRGQQGLNITWITFEPGAIYSTSENPQYSTVFIYFECTEPIASMVIDDATGTHVPAKIEFEVPHNPDGTLIEMSIGNNQKATFKRSPGDDVSSQFPNLPNWNYYNTPQYPMIELSSYQYAIRTYANTSNSLPSYMPKGYRGLVEVTDVLLPTTCKDPGEYTLRIGNVTAYHRPMHKGVLCPEFDNLQLQFSSTVYDSTNVNISALFQVVHYPLYAPSMYVGFIFPEGAYPNVYHIDPDADIDMVVGTVDWPNTFMINMSVFPERVGYDGLYQANLTGQPSMDNTQPHRPEVRRLLVGNYARANPGAWINLTVSDVTLPWDCLTNQTFCVYFGYFSKCIEIERPITNCPVLSNLWVEFFDSHYWNPSATLKLSFNVSSDPLYAKDKYKVKITFPDNQGYDIHGAFIKSAPIGYLVPDPHDVNPVFKWKPEMFRFKPDTLHTESVPPSVEFYLNGTSDQDPVVRQPFVDDRYVFFEIGNISLPLNCWEVHSSWKLEIGPWEIESIEDHEITGCPNITELDLTFWPPYQSTALSVATFSFFVDFHPLPVEPVTITMPYYTGSGETFTIKSSQYDDHRFQINGEANPPLTLYRGLTYYFDLQLCMPPLCSDHYFAIVEADGTPYVQQNFGLNDPHQSIPIMFNGVAETGATNLRSGVIEWTIPEFFTPELHYMNPSKPWMNGTISIAERPRAVQLTATSRITENKTQPLGDPYHGYGEMFKGRVDRYWIARDEPYISIQNFTEGVADTWSYENFRIVDGDPWGYGPGDPQRIPTGRMSFQLQDVMLPDDCSDLGNITLRFGPWYITENPPNDFIKCPRIEKLDVRFSTHVIGEKGVTATIKLHLFDAPLYPADIKILFPPSNDLRITEDARIKVAFNDWSYPQQGCLYDQHLSRQCYGRDEFGYFPSFALEDCKNYCDARPNCVSFELQKSGTGCYLSSSCTLDVAQNVSSSIIQDLYIKRVDTCSQQHFRQINNWEDIEVSIMERFVSGTPVWPNASSLDGSWGNHTEIEVYGIDMPIHCTQLGNFSVKIGKWRKEFNPTHDTLFCPNITNMDVHFFPTANQSATTDAYIYFNVTDYVDPRWIIVSLPQTVDTTHAFFGSAMEDNGQPGWELDARAFTNTQTDDWPTMRIGVRSGRRVAPGVHYIVIKNVTLPRGNCSDLGMWRIQIGDTLVSQVNPVSDVVENCVVLEQMDLQFLPDAEQGQIVDMVVSFNVTESSLRFVPGDSDVIRVKTSTHSGVQFTGNSQFKDVMGGSWIPALGTRMLSQTYFSQHFTAGGTIPFESRTQFTITNVLMPSTCFETGWWDVSIGLWTVRMLPITPGQGVLPRCPKIEDLEVRYDPNTPGTQAAKAQFYFTIKEIRLRAGTLKFNFPADSGIHLWSYTHITGPGDWQAVDSAVLVPAHGDHFHSGEDEVSFTQTFQGTPLEPGNHSFTVHGVSIPKNNCSDLGYYKLAVGKWTSTWTNPETDILACPGVVTPINATLLPYNLPRGYEKANYSFGFNPPSCNFNEIEIQFPTGFQVSGNGGVAEVVRSEGLNLATAEYVVAGPNVFQIRNISATCIGGNPTGVHSEFPNFVKLDMTNVGLGNSCDEGAFVISTRTCTYMDRSNGAAEPIRTCLDLPTNGAGVLHTTEAMPKGCDLCNACKYEYTANNGEECYSCFENGIKFSRCQLDVGASCRIGAETTTSTPELW